MNMKKTLSLLTVAALSISSFAALAVTASADSAKTQNDLVVVNDITRTVHTNTTAISNLSFDSTSSDYSYYNGVFTSADLSSISTYASYTGTDDGDHYSLNITEAGVYNFNILSQNGTGTKLTISNDGFSSVVTASAYANIGTFTEGESTSKNLIAFRSNAVYLPTGSYTVGLSGNNYNYYANLIAIKMHKMNFVEPITEGTTVKYNVSEGSGYGNSRATYNSQGEYIENSQGNNKKFILDFGYITLSEAFDKVTVCMGTNGNNPVTSIKIKVGGEQIAELTTINNTNNWNRAELPQEAIDASKKNLSGLLTIEATYTGDYAGNYEYVKFYNKAPVEKTEINKDATSTLSSTGSSYQRFTGNGDKPADAYMTSIDFNSQYAAHGLKWYITKTENEKTYVAEYGDLGTTFSGGTVYFGLVISGTEDQLNSITKVELR